MEKSRRWERWVGPKGELYVLVQVLLFGVIGAGPWLGAGPWAAGGLGSLSAIAGGLLLGVGAAGSLRALLDLGRNLSVLPHPKDGAEMVSTGAYAWVRHPIYAFVLALGSGWALLWRSPVAGLAWGALFLLFNQKARREERLLAARFDAYDAYRRRVRRFIPGIY